VLKINADGLKPATWGDSDALVVGELAVAIGNPLGKLGGTVTEGVISALSRDIEIDRHSMNLLQTSAAVNPGNSGGGLFNSRGELIGIVNAKSSGADIEGLGFAIPSNTAISVVADLIQHGHVQGREPEPQTPPISPNQPEIPFPWWIV
jgi:serine protease Do